MQILDDEQNNKMNVNKMNEQMGIKGVGIQYNQRLMYSNS